MLVHTVFFWLKNAGNAADLVALRQGTETLTTISEISTAYIGQPAATRRDVIDYSYDLSLTFIFATPADQEIYQEHPTHLKFVADCAHLWQRVQVYDALGD